MGHGRGQISNNGMTLKSTIKGFHTKDVVLQLEVVGVSQGKTAYQHNFIGEVC